MGLAVPAMPQREGFIGLSVWGYEGLGRTRAPSHRSLTVVLNLTPAATHRSTDQPRSNLIYFAVWGMGTRLLRRAVTNVFFGLSIAASVWSSTVTSDVSVPLAWCSGSSALPAAASTTMPLSAEQRSWFGAASPSRALADTPRPSAPLRQQGQSTSPWAFAPTKRSMSRGESVPEPRESGKPSHRKRRSAFGWHACPKARALWIQVTREKSKSGPNREYRRGASQRE